MVWTRDEETGINEPIRSAVERRPTGKRSTERPKNRWADGIKRVLIGNIRCSEFARENAQSRSVEGWRHTYEDPRCQRTNENTKYSAMYKIYSTGNRYYL